MGMLDKMIKICIGFVYMLAAFFACLFLTTAVRHYVCSDAGCGAGAYGYAAAQYL